MSSGGAARVWFHAQVKEHPLRSGVIPLEIDGNTVLGRGDAPFEGDSQVSREHFEVTVSLRGERRTSQVSRENGNTRTGGAGDTDEDGASDGSSGSGSEKEPVEQVFPSIWLRAISSNARRGSVVLRAENGRTNKEAGFASFKVGDVPLRVLPSDKIDMFGGRYVLTVGMVSPADGAPKADESQVDTGPGATLELSPADSVGLDLIERQNKRPSEGDPVEDDQPATPTKRRKMELTHGHSTVMMNPAELTPIRVVGSGSCGEVLECEWKGTRVAVKKIFRTLIHSDLLEELEHEVNTLRRLRHPNVVLFMGTCLDQDRGLLSVVTEFCELGSLSDVIHRALTGETPLAWRSATRMTADAARGLLYLHALDPPILHRVSAYVGAKKSR
jgi:Protein tyrosine and serine/threonine kinase